MVLDGRNRQRACNETGVAPRYRDLTDKDGHPLRFVIAKNLSRRHLDESQRAMMAAKVATMPHGGDYTSAQGANFLGETSSVVVVEPLAQTPRTRRRPLTRPNRIARRRLSSGVNGMAGREATAA
jgi:hypothetical protein